MLHRVSWLREWIRSSNGIDLKAWMAAKGGHVSCGGSQRGRTCTGEKSVLMDRKEGSKPPQTKTTALYACVCFFFPFRAPWVSSWRWTSSGIRPSPVCASWTPLWSVAVGRQENKALKIQEYRKLRCWVGAVRGADPAWARGLRVSQETGKIIMILKSSMYNCASLCSVTQLTTTVHVD